MSGNGQSPPPPGSGQRVMVIVAHPDDAEFGCAGTVAKWARAGKEIVYVLCTDGSHGTSDPTISPDRLKTIRATEQRAACARLGVRAVVFLDYEDGMLTPNLELRRDLTRVIRRYKPDIAIVQDPTRRWGGQTYLNHPDHRAAGEAALDAIYPAARDRWTFPELLHEGLEPHKVQEVFISGTDQPEIWVDITETIDDKLAALKEHHSQVGHWEPDKFVRERGRQAAEGHDMEYAETFKYLRLG